MPIFPTVLEGIAAFGHLIDASFFGDLIDVLKQVMVDPLMKTLVKLNCVRTGAMLLSGQGTALNIDSKAFYDVLYNELLNLGDSNDCVRLALDCVYKMLYHRKEVSLDRVAGFIKRLSLLLVGLESHQAITATAIIRILLNKYPKVQLLLDNDQLAGGVYRPEVPEPEHSNALGTSLWEMSALQSHYHPFLKMYATHVMANLPSSGAGALPLTHIRTSPEQLFKVCDPGTHGFSFNPEMVEPKNQVRKPRILKGEVVDPALVADIEQAVAASTKPGFWRWHAKNRESGRTLRLQTTLGALSKVHAKFVEFKRRKAANEVESRGKGKKALDAKKKKEGPLTYPRADH